MREYIEYYNNRIKLNLKGLSPIEYIELNIITNLITKFV
ncbi:IS3 family transposase [Sphingobacterium athyrii]